MGFLRKTKSEKGGRPRMGEPDYSSIRVVRGHYIEKDVNALIDNINKAGGISSWLKGKRAGASNQSPEASDKPHRSSEEPE